MVFIEYNVDNAPGSRVDRWWLAHGYSSVTLPLIMVDSGKQFTHGYEDFHTVYKSMVDAELARPPQAEIQASWWRSANTAQLYVQVKNLSGTSLGTNNSATLHAIVYEDAHVQLTGRFARSAVYTSITLANNATGTYKLATPDLVDVNWDKLHVIVMVDYRPGGSTGAYDMLQAAVADLVPAPFAAHPDTITFLVDPQDGAVPPVYVNFTGVSFLGWSGISNASWFTISPASGGMSITPAVSVDKNSLSPGWQQGSITFSTTDGSYTDVITVKAFVGPVEKSYLPVIHR